MMRRSGVISPHVWQSVQILRSPPLWRRPEPACGFRVWCLRPDWLGISHSLAAGPESEYDERARPF